MSAATTDRAHRRAWASLGLLAVAAAGLVAHMRVFRFVTDDAFISFVYARNLARHGELVFNLGERVEGYTNFLWTVLLAGGIKVGWRPESSSVVLGTAFALATMAVTLLWLRRTRADGGSSPWEALPSLCLAAIPGYACWSSGGLETQMFTFFVVLGGFLYLRELDEERPRPWSALAFGIAALTRPEGILFFGLTGLHRVLVLLRARRLRPTGRELAWVGVFLLVVVPHLLWRRHYYGWWLPNTFYIKSSAGTEAIGRGFYYLLRMAQQHALWLLGPLALVGLVGGEARARRAAGYVLLAVLGFLAYVVSVGGDFMGLFRFALPAMPLVVVAAVLGLRRLLDRLGGRPLLAGLAGLLVVGGLAAWAVKVDRDALVPGADNGIDTPGFLKRYTDNRAAIGKWFAKHVRDDDYAAVGGAGAQVYYSDIRSLDCFGLSDAHIAHRVAPSSNRPGHQKYAPLDYQLRPHCFGELCLRPTIITSSYYRIGPSSRCCPEISLAEEREWRARGYHYVSVEVPGLERDDHGGRAGWYTFLKRADRTLGPLGPLSGDID